MSARTTAQALLEALCAAPGRTLSVAELKAQVGTDWPQTSLEALMGRGLATAARRGVYQATPAGCDWVAAGRVLPLGGGDGRRGGWSPLHRRVWRALRVRTKVDLAELLPLVAGDDVADHRLAKRVQVYLRGLVAAGYCRRYGKKGRYRWLLVRDTGPREPLVWRSRRRPGMVTVRDQNTGEVTEFRAAREQSPTRAPRRVTGDNQTTEVQQA